MLHCELAQRVDLCELPFLLHREQIYLSSNKHGPSIDGLVLLLLGCVHSKRVQQSTGNGNG